MHEGYFMDEIKVQGTMVMQTFKIEGYQSKSIIVGKNDETKLHHYIQYMGK